MPKEQQPHHEIRDIVGLIGALLLIIFIIFETSEDSPDNGGAVLIIPVIYAVVVLGLIYWLFRKRQKRIAMENERIAMEIAMESGIDEYLREALETMDSTAKWYNNEEEANKELVTCLKAQGVEAEYQYRLPNGRTVDAKVYGFLIEGKLSPDTAEVDRLLGQLSDYTQYGNKVNVVIYGQLGKNARRRIENEIRLRYDKKVFLTYLDNPKRQRSY